MNPSRTRDSPRESANVVLLGQSAILRCVYPSQTIFGIAKYHRRQQWNIEGQNHRLGIVQQVEEDICTKSKRSVNPQSTPTVRVRKTPTVAQPGNFQTLLQAHGADLAQCASEGPIDWKTAVCVSLVAGFPHGFGEAEWAKDSFRRLRVA